MMNTPSNDLWLAVTRRRPRSALESAMGLGCANTENLHRALYIRPSRELKQLHSPVVAVNAHLLMRKKLQAMEARLRSYDQ